MGRLAAVLKQFAQALQEDPHALVPALADEPAPASIELVYHPPANKTPVAVEQAGRAGAGGVVAPAMSGELPANFRCSLCADRMYPVRRYNRPGRRPILVLYHSGSYGRGPARLDRSRDHIFGSPEEDDLFARMLGAVGLSLEDLHYQEYPACHFNAVRSTGDDWRDRGDHCLGHVHETVARSEIQLMILTGPAAVILLGEERALELSIDCGKAWIPVGDREVPALVMRSPAALIALENKRKKLKTRGGDEAAVKEALDEEKRVKNQVVAALKAAVPA